jgi:hypothetical protein
MQYVDSGEPDGSAGLRYVGRMAPPEYMPPDPEECMRTAIAGPNTCLFCGTRDWDWLHVLHQPPPLGPLALPSFVVACQVCEVTVISADQPALFTALTSGEDYAPDDAAELLDLFERVDTQPAMSRPT